MVRRGRWGIGERPGWGAGGRGQGRGGTAVQGGCTQRAVARVCEGRRCDDGGGGGRFPLCGSGWSLLAFTIAKMESGVPIGGEFCLTGEAGVENSLDEIVVIVRCSRRAVVRGGWRRRWWWRW